MGFVAGSPTAAAGLGLFLGAGEARDPNSHVVHFFYAEHAVGPPSGHTCHSIPDVELALDRAPDGL